MKEKFVKDEELVNPERYMQNKIEAWDFAIQSLFPYPLGVVSKYVIRHKHKGGKQDLEKALIWAKKAKESYKYISLSCPSGIIYFEEVPNVSIKNFPDLGDEEILILKLLQEVTSRLRDKETFDGVMSHIIKILEGMIENFPS
jgi:hypothetical protein